MFLGSAALFVPAVVRPYRNNVRLQLCAFLAYDLMFIIPFVRDFDAVRDDHLLSLIVHLTVILHRGAIAIYGLNFEPNVRVSSVLAHSSRDEAFRSV